MCLWNTQFSFKLLIEQVSLSPPLLTSFWKHTAWSSVCPTESFLPLDKFDVSILVLQLKPHSSLQVNPVLPYFCFMLGSVSLNRSTHPVQPWCLLQNCFWSIFLRASSWSIMKLWAQTWILHSYGELIKFLKSPQDLILEMRALSWRVKRFVMIKYLQLFLSTSTPMWLQEPCASLATAGMDLHHSRSHFINHSFHSCWAKEESRLHFSVMFRVVPSVHDMTCEQNPLLSLELDFAWLSVLLFPCLS